MRRKALRAVEVTSSGEGRGDEGTRGVSSRALRREQRPSGPPRRRLASLERPRSDTLAWEGARGEKEAATYWLSRERRPCVG